MTYPVRCQQREASGPASAWRTCHHFSGMDCQEVPFHCKITGMRLPKEPTAQPRPDGRIETAASTAQPGAGTARREVPFQCSVRDGPAVLVPTAQALSADEALTASRASPSGAGGFGLGVRLHRAPFQCRITVRTVTVAGTKDVPAAQAFLADVAATPPSEYV